MPPAPASRKDSSDSVLLQRESQVQELLSQVSPQVLGARLKRARQRQGLSIRDLAKRAGISKNSIVRLEQGGAPHALTVLKICNVLGFHVAGLAKNVHEDQIAVAHRSEDDRWYDLTDFGAGPLGGLDRPLSAEERAEQVRLGAKVPLLILGCRLENGRLLPTVLELYGPSEKRSHSGEEFVYVLSGSAVVNVGPESYTLNQGECLTFWSAEEHDYSPAPGAELPVRVLSVRIDDKTVGD